MVMNKTTALGWDLIEFGIKSLAGYLKSQDVKYVVGIPRGGLIPAVMLSHESEIPFLTLDKLETVGEISKKQIAIVDDISDSGVTLAPFITQGYTVVTLCHKVTCPIKVSRYVLETQETDWIKFPWERDDAKQIAGYLDKNEI